MKAIIELIMLSPSLLNLECIILKIILYLPIFFWQKEKSPLLLAAESGNEMKVLTLLDEGADIHFTQEVSTRYYII